MVMVPSQVQGAFGRVIVEAGQRGIPAAPVVGGIPESIGESAVLLEASCHQHAGRARSAMRCAMPSATHAWTPPRWPAQAGKEFEARAIAARFLDVLQDHRKPVGRDVS